MSKIKLLSQMICNVAKWSLEKYNLFHKNKNTEIVIVAKTTHDKEIHHSQNEELTQNCFLRRRFKCFIFLQSMINVQEFDKDNNLKLINVLSHFKNCLPQIINIIINEQMFIKNNAVNISSYNSLLYSPFYFCGLPLFEISNSKLFTNSSVSLFTCNRVKIKCYSMYLNNDYNKGRIRSNNINSKSKNRNINNITDKLYECIRNKMTNYVTGENKKCRTMTTQQETATEKKNILVQTCSEENKSNNSIKNYDKKNLQPDDTNKDEKQLHTLENKDFHKNQNINDDTNKSITYNTKMDEKSACKIKMRCETSNSQVDKPVKARRKTKRRYRNLCKKCKPKNVLFKYREHSPWAIWWYSLLGTDLTPKNRFPIPINRTENTTVKVDKPKEPVTYPKPTLAPSINHFGKDPKERINIKRQPVDKSDYTQEHKDNFVQSLVETSKINNRAKWAIADDSKTSVSNKTVYPKPIQNIVIENSESKQKECVESMQKKTQEFCKTLVALCKCKPKEEEIKNEVKTEKPKARARKPRNALITNEEYRKRREKKLKEQRDRYTLLGAGHTDQEMLKIKHSIEDEVFFKYREHCNKTPEERNQIEQ